MNTPSPNPTSKQKHKLLNHLFKGYRITVSEALIKLQIYALSQRLGELRRVHGIPIQSRFIRTATGTLIKEYWLDPEYIAQHKEKTA